MMTNIEYSVIIPFRNELNLLQTALASIPDRKDIQIVIIDNSINSLESQFVNKHTLCMVNYLVSNPSKGAGCARNVGLKYAIGKWLLFLDADDNYENNAFKLFDEYKTSDYDLIYFNITSRMLGTNKISTRHIRYEHKLNRYLNTGNENIVRYTFPTPYCKMVRRSMVIEKKIHFDETQVSNDVMFSIKCGYFAQKICAEPRVAYCVTEANQNGSLTKQNTFANLKIRYKVAIRVYLMMRKIGHIEAAPSLYGYVLTALRKFGWKNFIYFVKLGIRYKVNFFIKYTKKGWIG